MDRKRLVTLCCQLNTSVLQQWPWIVLLNFSILFVYRFWGNDDDAECTNASNGYAEVDDWQPWPSLGSRPRSRQLPFWLPWLPLWLLLTPQLPPWVWVWPCSWNCMLRHMLPCRWRCSFPTLYNHSTKTHETLSYLYTQRKFIDCSNVIMVKGMLDYLWKTMHKTKKMHKS